MTTSQPIESGFTPLFERVLIKPDQIETTTSTGIILPVEARQRPNTGTILALGHLITKHTGAPLKVGDKVLYQKYSGLDFKWNGSNYHLVMANDILGILAIDEQTTFQLQEHV